MTVPTNTEDITVVRLERNLQTGDSMVASEHLLPGCVVAPVASAENLQMGEQVSTQWTVYVLNGADIKASDRVRRPSDPDFAGSSDPRRRAPWQVVGDPAAWKSPFSSWSPGLVVTIKRVS